MKKKFLPGVSLISRLTLTLCLAFAGFASANAAEQDLGKVEFGKDYQLNKYSAVTGYFVAPATGTVYQKGGDVAVYSDAAHEIEVQ